jgi:hypothetical protein
MDTLPIILLHGPSGCGKIRIAQSICSNLSLNLSKVFVLFKLNNFMLNFY